MQAKDPLVGRTLANYRLDERLGEGGMGVVYRATDLRLQRAVAVKVLGAGSEEDPERQRRLLREARAASALNHPGIVTVHEVNAAEGVSFIVMELVAGRPLSSRLAEGPLTLDETLHCGAQLAAALQAAHAAGIVHRDIKPANVILGADGRLKVLDFGLARPLAPATPVDSGELTFSAASALTRPGVLVGTPSYMSPEQARGEPAGPATDIFAAGIVLYEMVTGRRAFARPSLVTTLAAILQEDAPHLSDVRPGTPGALAELVAQCLRKDPAGRPSAEQLRQRLLAIQASRAPGGALRRPWLAAALLVLLALAAFAVVWQSRRASRREWAHAIAPNEIRRLAGEGSRVAAFRLALEALAVVPDNAELRQELSNLSFEASIETDPQGALVEYTDYPATLPWQGLGRTPLPALRAPLFARWRVSHEGYDSLESTGEEETAKDGRSLYVFRLEKTGTSPPAMVRVPEGTVREFDQVSRKVPEFWIDRYEVTNRDYRAFVDAGGYREPRYWPELLDAAGGSGLAQAVAPLVDSTGRPGPATWEVGAPPEGKENLPVGGVSFYEACAYARFAGKELPTAYHWARASGMDGLYSDILSLSGFDGKGPAAAGTYKGVGPFGTYDMAGNVKEWVRNAASGRRYILGGAWNEPPYTFRNPDALPPMERRAQNGFRCIKAIEPWPEALAGPMQPRMRDYARETPVPDAVFAAYARLYGYDEALPLEARVEQADDSNPHWRKETVSIAAAYGGERLPIYLYVPRHTRAPYQAVVFHPGGDSLQLHSSRELWLSWVDFVVRSGRLVAYPVLKGTYERKAPIRAGSDWRDQVVQRAKDVSRTVQYLRQRPDVAGDRLAYYGLSLGAQSGLTAAAMTPHFRTVVLAAGGLRHEPQAPEIDGLNFAPRIVAPTLMVNGRDDFNVPLETSQLPLFRLLGAPASQKRHVLLEGGHIPPRMQEIVRVVLDWLDAQLGVPERAGPEA